MEKLIQAIEEVTQVTHEMLRSASRVREVSDARAIYYTVGDKMGFTTGQLSSNIRKECLARNRIITLSDRVDANEDVRLLKEAVEARVGIADLPIMEKPLFDDEFYIKNVSSKFFGKYFIGFNKGNIVTHGTSYIGVVNKMIDLR